MTNKDAKRMLNAKLMCLTREASGKDEDCLTDNCGNCALFHGQGNIKEQIKALDIAIKDFEIRPCNKCKFLNDKTICEKCWHNYTTQFMPAEEEVNADGDSDNP